MPRYRAPRRLESGHRHGVRSFALTGGRRAHDAPSEPDPSPLGIAGTWALQLNDDFNGAAGTAPNGDLWDYWLQDQERNSAINRAENTYLDGSSNLVIRITNANIGYGSELSAGGLVSVSTWGDEFVTESRILSNSSGSCWGAFWCQTRLGMEGLNEPPDPADGAEYDIFETWSGGPATYNVHWGGYGENHSELGLTSYGVTKDEFHVYAMHLSVSGNFVRFYCDGALEATFTDIVSTRNDQEIRLTNETNGATSLLTYVDYCRVWVPG